MRNSSDGTPSHWVMTATRLKSTRALGRENLAKMSPVIKANPSTPHQGFDHDQDIGKERLGHHPAIANRGHRLNAEKEGIAKGARPRVLDAAGVQQLAERKERVANDVAGCHA